MGISISGGVKVPQGRFSVSPSAASGPPAEIAVNAVEFDATNDYLTRDAAYTDASDGDKGAIAVWVKMSGSDTLFYQFLNIRNGSENRLIFRRSNDGTILLQLRNSSNTRVLQFTTDLTLEIADGWQCVMISWDTSAAAEAVLYVGDTAASLTISTQIIGTIEYTGDNAAVGASVVGGNKIDGCLSQVYLNIEDFIDFSVEDNRRKFFSSGGKPVDLGSDGSDPTGNIPILFLSGPTVSWHTNKGAGGGMTENGALTDCADSPSD